MRPEVWDEEAIIDAMIAYRLSTKSWPTSRSWWYANDSRWPSFSTVCKKMKWSDALRLARAKYFKKDEAEETLSLGL